MRDINKVMLMGRLGMDPTLRTTQNGTSVANFSLATENYAKDRQDAETTWHRIVVWGKPAEWCHQQLHKGSSLFIEGRIKTKKYEDEEGKAKYMTEVHADQVHFLYGKAKNGAASDHVAVTAEPAVAL